MSKSCRFCGGNGKLGGREDSPCVCCKGSGQMEPCPNATYFKGSPWPIHDHPDCSIRCPLCEGRSWVRASSSCFIATAAWGSAQAEDVVRLRAFRDAVLRQAVLGRTLINIYEAVSPPIARFVARSALLRGFVRWALIRPARMMADHVLRGKQQALEIVMRVDIVEPSASADGPNTSL